MNARLLTALAAGLATAAPALAQVQIKWTTIDGGGGDMTGGTLKVRSTIGQPDAGVLASGPAELKGGFWPGPASCYPDCNDDGALDVSDFGCFTNKFIAGNLYADCNGDAVLDITDFGCYTNKFIVGCP
jgi:hypothetical protein